MAIGRNMRLERGDSVISSDFETTVDCCMANEDFLGEDETEMPTTSNQNSKTITTTNDEIIEMESKLNEQSANNEILQTPETAVDTIDGRVAVRKRAGHACSENTDNWAEHKNVAEGLMDIALLSANANQLRFLITYNNKASTYFISLGLVVLSLALQVVVGIVLIFKRRIKRSRGKRTHNRLHELLIGGVFMVTVVNVLLAAFTTTDNNQN